MPARTPLSALAVTLAAALAAPMAVAEEFEPVTDEREFVQLIRDRELKRFAINLRVTPEGAIVGTGFGRDVSGDWDWREGYFCRDLYWGETELGFNCQKVLRKGATLRFIENKGEGRFADLRLD